MKLYFVTTLLGLTAAVKANYAAVDLPVVEDFKRFKKGEAFFLKLDLEDGDNIQQKNNAVKKRMACKDKADLLFVPPTYCPDYHGDDPYAECDAALVPAPQGGEPCGDSVVQMKGDSFLVSKPLNVNEDSYLLFEFQSHVQGVEEGDSFGIDISADGDAWDDEGRVWLTIATFVAEGWEDAEDLFFISTTDPIYTHDWSKMFFRIWTNGNQESDRIHIGNVVIQEL